MLATTVLFQKLITLSFMAVTWSALLFEYTVFRTYNLLNFMQVLAEIKDGIY